MRLTRIDRSAPVASSGPTGHPLQLDRRHFLKTAGLGVGVAASLAPLAREVAVAEAQATNGAQPPKLEAHKTICGNCAVGCGFIGEVQKGVWVSQEPWFEHPVNLGSLCSKGAAAREHVISEKRLRYPMKLEGGKWKRISWDQAMSEIVAKIEDIRKKYGPDAVQFNLSAHHMNEMAYAGRKFVAFMGTTNVDHQARICHSTTVTGLSNVWGYGAMTNSMNDIRNSKSILIIGENPCESHPISMQHILTAKEVNRAVVMVVDPRFTKTAAFAHRYVRHRSGTDVAFINGLIHIILAKGWEDKRMIRERTYGFDEFRDEIDKYDPDTVANITGVSKADLEFVARTLAQNRPGCVIWAMGGTQHSNGTAVVRSYCTLQLVLGNMGKMGGGANVFRGHDNVQGATDLGVEPFTLPFYYGLSKGAHEYFAKVWDVPYEWMAKRYASEAMMQKPGFTVARWYEGVLQDKKDLGQSENLHAVIFWGQSSNSLSQMDRQKKALEKIDLVVDIDPVVTNTAVLPDRADNMYLLPAATVYEGDGSVTNSSRHLQWREKIVSPVWEARQDLAILLDFAERFGFLKEFAKNSKHGAWKGLAASYKDVKEVPVELVDSLLREINYGSLTIGYIGQTPERLRRQRDWGHAFNLSTLRAEGGPLHGEQWGLPWPCWTDKHPGTQILWRDDIPVKDGGLPFRVRWGKTSPDNKSMLAAPGAAPPGGPRGGYDAQENFSKDLTHKAIQEAIADGRSPIGNGRARFKAWNIPDPIPIHREPIHSPRPDLIVKYPTYDDLKEQNRVPTLFKSLQKEEWAAKYPLVLTSGRQVEFEGGGAMERACWWLVELQPEMYAEINPKTATDHGIRHGDWMWVESPEDLDEKPSSVKVKARVTRRVGPDTIFLPFHWGGSWQGKSLAAKYPEGTVPYGVGDSANTVTNYGYDRVTQMQETKTGLCRIRKA